MKSNYSVITNKCVNIYTNINISILTNYWPGFLFLSKTGRIQYEKGTPLGNNVRESNI